VISDGRTAGMVDPQFAYDNVIDERVDFSPRVVVASLCKVHVRSTWITALHQMSWTAAAQG